jgi:acetoin utilization deacetylase AcuC-like enzyme
MGRSPYGIRVPRTVWLRHPLSLAHEVPRHPERPERIVALEAEMERHDWFGCDVVLAPEATREQLLAVHPAAHIDSIEELSASGGGPIDYDTVATPAT